MRISKILRFLGLGAVGLYSFNASAALYDVKWLDLALGVKFRTNIEHRSATFFNAWQISPVIYLGFFENRLQFLVSRLDWVDTIRKDKVQDFRYRVGIGQVNDEPLFESGGEFKGIRNLRSSTFEIWAGVEWYRYGLGELIFRIYHDIKAHNGQFFELELRADIPKFRIKTEIRPQLFIQLGYGTESHNGYAYGPGAEAGLSSMKYGVQLQLPERYDRNYPAFQLYGYTVLGAANRNGFYLDGKRSGVQANATFALSIF